MRSWKGEDFGHDGIAVGKVQKRKMMGFCERKNFWRRKVGGPNGCVGAKEFGGAKEVVEKVAE